MLSSGLIAAAAAYSSPAALRSSSLNCSVILIMSYKVMCLGKKSQIFLFFFSPGLKNHCGFDILSGLAYEEVVPEVIHQEMETI